MAQVTEAELRKLRQLEERIVSANDMLASVRGARDEARSEAKALRATTRAKDKDIRELRAALEKTNKQVGDLIAENALLNSNLEEVSTDQLILTARSEGLVTQNQNLVELNESATAEVKKLSKALKESNAAQGRLSKQVDQLTSQLGDGEAPVLQPAQLSALLSEFVGVVGAQTGLRNVSTELNLKVGFTGRNGGSFVVPSAGTDRDLLPELHNIKIELVPSSVEATEQADLR